MQLIIIVNYHVITLYLLRGARSIVINPSVCASVRVSVCLSQCLPRAYLWNRWVRVPAYCLPAWGWTDPHKIFRPWLCFPRRRCTTLCTSGFMDDVAFGRNGREAGKVGSTQLRRSNTWATGPRVRCIWMLVSKYFEYGFLSSLYPCFPSPFPKFILAHSATVLSYNMVFDQKSCELHVFRPDRPMKYLERTRVHLHPTEPTNIFKLDIFTYLSNLVENQRSISTLSGSIDLTGRKPTFDQKKVVSRFAGGFRPVENFSTGFSTS